MEEDKEEEKQDTAEETEKTEDTEKIPEEAEKIASEPQQAQEAAETGEEPAQAEEEKKAETIESVPEETPTAVEEEAKPAREEKPEEEEIVEERIYKVPLGRAWIVPQRRRAARAMRILRAFVTKHMKLDAREEGEEEEEPKKLVIDNEVNEKIWSRGIEKPPRKIRIRVTKDKEGNVNVYLAEGD
jgi:large subunit ribosomal protein L31e